VDILKLLDKSNCGQCGEPTCMAFAAKVFSGQKELGGCPVLDRSLVEENAAQGPGRRSMGQEMDEALAAMKKALAGVDLEEAAARLGARYGDGRLFIRVLGKDLSVDSQGRILTDIHVNAWVMAPVFEYITRGRGLAVTGKWLGYRELENGAPRYGLFVQRIELPLRQLADRYPDLFRDLLEIFSARQVENQLGSDLSIVLNPLPLVPVLICYWRPEEGIESDVKILFDDTADKNLSTESIFTLCAGLVQMFEKISMKHGFR